MHKKQPQDIIIFKPKGRLREISVNLKDETVWVNLNQLVTLFQRDKSVISRHMSNIFKSNELQRKPVVAKFATTAKDGKTYQVDYYNLDMIISLGYRINSRTATHFRIWATNVLRDHLVKGYTINEKHLKAQAQIYQELQNSISVGLAYA